MPEVTGIQMLQLLRRVSAAPAVALSGFGMESDIRKSLDAGFVAHLTKPIDLDRLLSVIESVAAGADLHS